jgi:exosortase B
MSALLDIKRLRGGVVGLEWMPVAAGLLLLYVPTFYDAATTFWQTDEYAHGPIILAVIVWLIWSKRGVLADAPALPAPAAGISLLVFGLLLYVLGRSQNIALFEIGALIPVLGGSLLAMRGWQVLRAFAFPLMFVVFMLPLPGTFIDALTGPLKQQVSALAEHILYAAGYPIARNGVVLTVGQYEMLVADACSGLNTMYSLSALGVLFMYLTARTSLLHNAIMVVSILPIAFIANVVRVLVLILITYHYGDEAGQGYLHGSAGIVLLLAALAALLLLDAILARLIKPRNQAARPGHARSV